MDAATRPGVNMRLRWTAWALAILVWPPIAVWGLYASPALYIFAAMILQLVCSIAVARGKSQTAGGRIGWAAGLWLASFVLCFAAVWVFYSSFGQSSA